jgi:hypothetical protein
LVLTSNAEGVPTRRIQLDPIRTLRNLLPWAELPSSAERATPAANGYLKKPGSTPPFGRTMPRVNT